MERIELPLVDAAATLGEVFDRMADCGRHAALVVRPGMEPVLVNNIAVDEAFDHGLEFIGQVGGIPLHVVNAEIDDWESALDEASVSYGVVTDEQWPDRHASVGGDADVERRPGAGMVTIVTRYERLADNIRNAGEVCRCTRHRHKAPRGGPCPYCHSEVRCA